MPVFERAALGVILWQASAAISAGTCSRVLTLQSTSLSVIDGAVHDVFKAHIATV